MRVVRSSSPPPRSDTPELVPQSLPSPHLSRRKSSSSRLNLKLAYSKDSPASSPRSTASSLPQSDRSFTSSESSSYPLSQAVAKLDLAIDEFGPKDIGPKSSSYPSRMSIQYLFQSSLHSTPLSFHIVDKSMVTFPGSEPDVSSNPSPYKRGHRRSSASSPRQSSHSIMATPHPRLRSRSGSPPPVTHKSPPPPIPPIPSFLLSAAHKTTDEDGLQHIYISDMNFGYSISSSPPDNSSPAQPRHSSSPHTLTHVKIFAVHHGGS
jgi:hypothetical protein